MRGVMDQEALGGTILMGARVYDPTVGRFLQTDPVEGGSANRYEYCSGDPVGCASTTKARETARQGSSAVA